MQGGSYKVAEVIKEICSAVLSANRACEANIGPSGVPESGDAALCYEQARRSREQGVRLLIATRSSTASEALAKAAVLEKLSDWLGFEDPAIAELGATCARELADFLSIAASGPPARPSGQCAAADRAIRRCARPLANSGENTGDEMLRSQDCAVG